MRVAYLSAPFSTGLGPGDTEAKRQQTIDAATAWLLKHCGDVFIFSPITYERPLKDIFGVREDKVAEWDFWRPRDEAMVRVCDELWVLQLPGWDRSRGVAFEIETAKRFGKPVYYVQVNEDGTFVNPYEEQRA